MYFVGYRPNKKHMLLTITNAPSKKAATKIFTYRGNGFPPTWVAPIKKDELNAAVDLQFAGWRGTADKFRGALKFARDNPGQFSKGRIF